jgi:ferredoxin
VNRERCVGCGLCAAMNPRVFMMDDDGRAKVRVQEFTTTPLGDVAVRICPTCAISAEVVPPLES